MKFIKNFLCGLFLVFGAFAPNTACASIIDALDISGLVPIVLDSFMYVANGTYAYFVGDGNGIVYVLVWGFFIFYIASYLIKLYVPKFWLTTFGFKPGDSINNTGGIKIIENLLKPSVRALVAVIVLLPLHPDKMAKYLINPFLSFGSIYTSAIIQQSTDLTSTEIQGREIHCPENLLNQGWLDAESCNYLIQPVHVLSGANNAIVKRGFQYISNGFQSLATFMIRDGHGFMDIISGILLVVTFTGCNIFMALLIIQAIFNFGMALILYPFNVVAWVAKKNDSWFDIWPAFSGIIDALKQIIITMIACAFILCVNMALIHALFQWNNNAFTNGGGGFGGHSVLWLSCILTFFLMNKLFEITREKLTEYVGNNGTELYNKVKKDAKTGFGIAKAIPGKVKDIKQYVKGK